jgi:4-amino-4-deoxy-L-arabinose transferase-like glycosyltransferase
LKRFKMTDKENGETYLNKYFVPYLPLILLIIIAGVISYYRLLIQMDIGPISDTCDFLLNALYFSGQGVGYYDWTRPVFFPLLIAMVFKLGFVSATAAYVVDLLIYIFGLIGFYLLLSLHFNKIESFFGGLLYATFPIIILLSGLGFSDFACGAFIIWAFYFLVLAVKKNSKFFILFFLFWTMAFLTRFNAALIIFPVILYIFMNKQEIKSHKYIGWGILASFLLIIPVLWFYQIKFGNILFPFMDTFGATSRIFSPEYHPYNVDPLFYIKGFFSYTGFESFIITFLIIIGIAVYTIIRVKNQSDIRNKLLSIVSKEDMNLKFELLIFAVLTLIFIVTFGQVHYMVSEVIFLAVGLVFFTLINELNIKNIDLHILVFSWFMAFFIFNSVYVIKSSRYFILMAPGVAYLLLLGLRTVFNELTVKLKKGNLIFPIFALILTVLILLSTASLLPSIEDRFQGIKVTNEKIALASEWFINYEPDYKNKVIYSNLWPYLAWHLKTDVKIMFTFKNNQAYLGGVKDNTTFTQQDNLASNNYLVDNNADYYFSSDAINLTSYKPIKQFGSVTIYERI